MKRTTVFLALFLSLASCAFAQKDYPTPEYSNRVYAVSSDVLADLDRGDASLSANAFTGLMSWSLQKDKSAYRLKSGSIPPMLVKIEGGGDPAEALALYKAEIKNNKRTISTGKKLGGKSKDMSASEVKLSFKKVRDGVYEISFVSPLTPGEYVFLPVEEANKVNILSPSKIKMSSFGVD